jgi:hypothetical protein
LKVFVFAVLVKSESPGTWYFRTTVTVPVGELEPLATSVKQARSPSQFAVCRKLSVIFEDVSLATDSRAPPEDAAAEAVLKNSPNTSVNKPMLVNQAALAFMNIPSPWYRDFYGNSAS